MNFLLWYGHEHRGGAGSGDLNENNTPRLICLCICLQIDGDVGEELGFWGEILSLGIGFEISNDLKRKVE